MSISLYCSERSTPFTMNTTDCFSLRNVFNTKIQGNWGKGLTGQDLLVDHHVEDMNH